MKPEQWSEVRRLFRRVVDLPPAQREAVLAEEDPEPEVLVELGRLLDADTTTDPLLDAEVADLAGALAEELSPMPSLEGRMVGPYRILEEIGHGGMGAVYRAERDDVDKQVALKLVRGGMAAADLRARFLLERRVLARLEHPNIARLMDAGVTEDETPYFVMEFVEGERITTYCERRGLDLESRLRLFLQVCDAVRYAHTNLIVHRDLKPGNILVTEDGVPKLLDFGIAKLLADEEEGADFTKTGSHLMSPEYAAPEQMTGDPITAATDVYVLGILFCEVLTGRRPYEVKGTSPVEVASAILTASPRRPSLLLEDALREGAAATEPGGTPPSFFSGRFGSEVARDLDAICLAALERDPARRYRSADQLYREIERVLEGHPVEARLPTVGYRFSKFVRRNRLAVGAVVAVVLSLAGGLGAALWKAAETERARAETAAALARSEVVTDFFMDLLSANDPNETRGEELTARELLDRGIEEARELEADTLLYAELLSRVSEVYNSLGEYAKAEPLAEEAIGLKRAVYGTGHSEVIDLLNALGVSKAMGGNLPGSSEVFRQAIDEGSAGLAGEEDENVLTAMSNLGVVLRRLGDLAGAEAIYRRTIEVQRRVLDEDDGDLTSTLNNLAVLLHRKGDLAGAEPVFTEVVDRQRRYEGEDSPRYAFAMGNLAILLQDLDRLDEAEELLRRSHAIQKLVLGEEHPEYAMGLHNLGQVLLRQGDIEAADTLLQQSLELHTARYDEDHPGVLQVVHTIAELQLESGNAAEAEQLFRETLERRRSVLGPENGDVVKTLIGLGATLDALGRPSEANTVYTEAAAVAAAAGLQSGLPDVIRICALATDRELAGAAPLCADGP